MSGIHRATVEEFLAIQGPDTLSAPEVAKADLNLVHPAGARASLWWTQTPEWDGRRTGFIGHFAAPSAKAGTELLQHAATHLGAKGCAWALGPIDGSTWKRYRALTERGPEPPFFLEPDNPDDWPSILTAAGFAPMATYVSSLVEPQPAAGGWAKGEHALREHGIRLRTLDLADFRAELTRLHPLALSSFQGNLLYTPQDLPEFLAQYEPLARHLDPRILWIAERGNEPVAFSFALPDLLQAQRGQGVDQAVLKTLAVHPSHAGVGVGAAIAARNLQACWDAGYRRVVGALMHEANRSRRISDHYGPAFRRYALYAKELP